MIWNSSNEYWPSPPINQSINQPKNQTIFQLTNQNESIVQSTHQQPSQFFNQHTKTQSIDHLTNQLFNKLIKNSLIVQSNNQRQINTFISSNNKSIKHQMLNQIISSSPPNKMIYSIKKIKTHSFSLTYQPIIAKQLAHTRSFSP